MRTARRGIVGLTLAAVALAVLPATTARAADTSPPQLVDVQFSNSAVTLTGFAYTSVQLRLHLTDDTGVIAENGSASGFPDYPFAVLTKTTAGRGEIYRLGSADFALTSGTAKDGWWTATLWLTSGYDGTWTVTEVAATDGSNLMDVDPRTQGITRTLQITGKDIPHLSMRQTPDPVLGTNGGIGFYGHVTDADTGAPLRATVHMGFESSCSDTPFMGSESVTPAADGSWRLAFDHWMPNFGCASIFNLVHIAGRTVPVFYVAFFFAPHYRWPVGASLAATSIKLGESTTVNGSTGAVGETVRLQRLVSGAWHTVGSTRVHLSGRFTLVAQPPSRGNHRYRVLLLPTIPGERASSSRVLVLGVT